jgi:hypothetical protein
LNHQNPSIERYRVRGADRPTGKSQPPRAKAPWDRDFARACHDGPDAIVRHTAAFFAFAAALSLTNCKGFVREMWGCAMRAGIVAGCIALAVLVSGCDTTDSRYFRYGIGTDLYSDDIVQTTQFQDIYLTELCRQALPVLSSSEGQCLSGVAGSNGWNLIVQAGFNDVDRRCDSYLAWLDDRRRTNNAVLKELGDVTVASQAIMNVAGVSANPITLVGLAFGLAANTFTNVNSRLLLEVDKTTVQTLVLRRRDDYRLRLRSINVDNRPAAIHALRSYLNICTPFAIETDINSTITVFQVGGAGALDSRPLINAETVRTGVISDVRRQLPSEGFRPSGAEPVKVFNTRLENALCVPLTGQKKDEAVRDFFVGRSLVSDTAKLPITNVPKGSQLLQNVASSIDDCKKKGLRNAYEVGRFGMTSDQPAAQVTQSVDDLQTGLRTKLGMAKNELTSGKIDAATRKAIVDFRNKFDIDKSLGDQIDNRLVLEATKGL